MPASSPNASAATPRVYQASAISGSAAVSVSRRSRAASGSPDRQPQLGDLERQQRIAQRHLGRRQIAQRLLRLVDLTELRLETGLERERVQVLVLLVGEIQRVRRVPERLRRRLGLHREQLGQPELGRAPVGVELAHRRSTEIACSLSPFVAQARGLEQQSVGRLRRLGQRARRLRARRLDVAALERAPPVVQIRPGD